MALPSLPPRASRAPRETSRRCHPAAQEPSRRRPGHLAGPSRPPWPPSASPSWPAVPARRTLARPAPPARPVPPARPALPAHPSSPGPRSTPPWSPGGAPSCRSPSRRRRTRAPTARSSARTAPRTRCPPRPPAGSAVRLTAGPVRRVHAAGRGQRDHRPLQHSRRAARWRHHRAARRHGQRQAPQDHDADVASTPGCTTSTRSPTTPTPTCCTPTGGSPSARCVPADTTPHADDHQAVPPDALLRRAAPAARQDLPGRRQGTADRTGAAATPPGPSSTCSTPSWSAPPRVERHAVNVVHFGADPTGRRDSADAFDRAIAFAKRRGSKVYIPPGMYQVNRHIIVDDVTIEGAGNWYTLMHGPRGRPARPAPDKSVHTGVGFYGRYAAGRWQLQRAPVRLRHRGRRTGAHRHRPGQRRRRRD